MSSPGSSDSEDDPGMEMIESYTGKRKTRKLTIIDQEELNQAKQDMAELGKEMEAQIVKLRKQEEEEVNMIRKANEKIRKYLLDNSKKVQNLANRMKGDNFYATADERETIEEAGGIENMLTKPSSDARQAAIRDAMTDTGQPVVHSPPQPPRPPQAPRPPPALLTPPPPYQSETKTNEGNGGRGRGRGGGGRGRGGRGGRGRGGRGRNYELRL